MQNANACGLACFKRIVGNRHGPRLKRMKFLFLRKSACNRKSMVLFFGLTNVFVTVMLKYLWLY